jgi:hypothetical protein
VSQGALGSRELHELRFLIVYIDQASGLYFVTFAGSHKSRVSFVLIANLWSKLNIQHVQLCSRVETRTWFKTVLNALKIHRIWGIGFHTHTEKALM